MAYKTLKLETRGEVATLTLTRPEKRNAISAEMVGELLTALEEAGKGPAGVVILTGSGKSFCSGMDLEALQSLATQSPEQNLEDSRRMARLFRRIWSFPKPTIAAVNGAAMAGGFGIATQCDFTISVPDAKFGYTEVRIGFLPALVSVFLRRQIGEKAARDLLLTGRVLDAAEAHRLGLVTQIVPQKELMPAAATLASALLAGSPTSVARTKKLLIDFEAADVDRELELSIAENARIRGTSDFREGIASFLEKRPPRWSGT
jgi:methylglutaconyl-CoA hydratase